jgi:hypothetical protein
MQPLFIGGHPRSGTTLLGAMVGAHSDCICTPESQFKTRVLRHRSLKKTADPDLQAAFSLIARDWRFKIWNISLPSVPFSEIHSYADLVLFLVHVFAENNSRKHPRVWVDHTPSNIKKENAHKLLELFPDGRFVHIVRDGRAVAASIIPLDWGANTIDRAAHSWRKRVSQYCSVESELGPQRVMRVLYEDLVREPEKTVKELCSFSGIEYQPSMAGGKGFHVPDYTASQHTLVGSMPDRKQIEAWRQTLTSRQVEIFESIAGTLLSTLGYHLIYKEHPKRISLSEKLTSGMQEFYRGQIINRIRSRWRVKQGLASLQKNV